MFRTHEVHTSPIICACRSGKTHITICLDDAILQRFKADSERTGKGYQTLINEALSQHMNGAEPDGAARGRP